MMKNTFYFAFFCISYAKGDAINTDEDMLVRLENVKNHPYSMKSLAVNGNDVAKLGVRGSEIGRILNILLEEVINDPSKNTKEQLILHIKSLIE